MTQRSRLGTSRLAFAGLALVLAVSSGVSASIDPHRETERPADPRAAAILGGLPVHFEPTRGTDGTGFVARGREYGVRLAADRVDLVPRDCADGRGVVSAVLDGARSGARVVGHELLAGVSHYYLGSDPTGWRAGVPHFGRVVAEDVYDGVDVSWRAAPGRNVAYDFVVAPGADVASIRLRFEGAERTQLEANGSLLVVGASGEFRHSRPVIYQELNGERVLVRGGFVELAEGVFGFRIGAHDPERPLVIDPTVAYSSYLGGGGSGTIEIAYAVSVDASGAAYIAGQTAASDFPTASAAQSTYGGAIDAFVTKLNASGSGIVYSTFLGGSQKDTGEAIAIDATGAAFVTGWVQSTNFPTQSAYQSSNGGGNYDAYAVKLSSTGGLVYSTYLGGSGDDFGRGIATDGNGAAFVTGETRSSNFPTQAPLYGSLSGTADAFVTKVASTGSSLTYSTYLGGSGGTESGQGIAVDGNGRCVVGGKTDSSNFPTLLAAQSSSGGGIDAFVTKLNSTGGGLVFSTYHGGANRDRVMGLDVDSSGNVYIAGLTESADLPTNNAEQASHGGGSTDAFVAKFAGGGTSRTYSTYLGGSGGGVGQWNSAEMAWDLAVDGSGRAYVVGSTPSTDFPTKDAWQATNGGGAMDGFAVRYAADGQSLDWASYLGGSSREDIAGVAVGPGGSVYVVGRTGSTDFPTQSPYQSTFAGPAYDGFITKLGPSAAPAAPADLVADSSSDVSIELSWSDADDLEASFELERAVGNAAFGELVTLSANVESYTDGSVSAATSYRYRVRAMNSVGPSDWSNIATAQTPSPAPTGVSASSSSNRSVTLMWSDDADDETGYIVERANGCPGVTWSVLATLPPNSTTYTDNSVQPETTYSYRVRTQGSEADSTPSLEVCIVTGPANPTSLLAITESDSGVLLRWGDNSAIESSYEIERQATGGEAEVLRTVPANSVEHSDNTVAAETEYSYRVRARTSDAMSSWSPKATTRTAPAAPSDPFGEAVSSSRVRLTWTDNSSVEKGFEVRRRIHGAETPSELVARLTPNVTSFLDEGLLQETSYDYTVNAYDSAGDSNPIAIDDLETTAVLVIRSVKAKAAKARKKGEKPAALTVKAEIDFGGYQPDAANGVTIGVNVQELAISGVVVKKSGKVLTGESDGVSIKLTRKSATASRGKLTIKVSGEPAEIDLDAELTISFTTGAFTAAGSIVPSSGRFDLKKRVGLRIDPDVVPTKLKLKLSGPENDGLQLGATFEPRAVPDEQPNALVTVGESRLIFSGESAQVSGGKVTYRLEGLPDATLVVDYDKGWLELKAKKHELGDYPKGDVPTLLDVVIGELRWRDVPVLRSTGKSATY